tara:strand:- start:327 stop:488 length:162 start_codon:yes stop_codon:yes gene_type:complete
MQMPKLDKLKIRKIKDNWVVDIKIEIGRDESDYWDLETEDEVEDFVNLTLSHH